MALSNFDIYSVLAAEHSRISSGPSDTEVAKDTEVPKKRKRDDDSESESYVFVRIQPKTA
jgi:hypothetical protein